MLGKNEGEITLPTTTAVRCGKCKVRRTKTITLRLTPDEHHALRARAAAIGVERRRGYSMEELLREAAAEFIKRGIWS